MRKNFRSITASILAFSVAAILASCGSSASTKQLAKEPDYYGDSEIAMAEEAAPAYEEEYYDATDDVYEASERSADSAGGTESAEILSENTQENTQSSNRKLIKNVNLNIETEEFDKFLSNIESRVNTLGGYIEMSEVSGRSYYNTTANRHASITVRVPNDKLDTFLSSVAEQSNITNKSVTTEDVTLQYADTQAHIESLKSEQKRLNDLITKAEDLDTLLTLEARLTEVSYQIESYERQIRSMDNKVDYSTVYIYADEVTHYTPVEEVKKTAGERIRTGLAENMYRIGNGFKEFGIGFVIGLPFIILTLLILGAIFLVIFLIVRGIMRAARKSAQKNIQRTAQMQQNAANAQQQAQKTNNDANDKKAE